MQILLSAKYNVTFETLKTCSASCLFCCNPVILGFINTTVIIFFEWTGTLYLWSLFHLILCWKRLKHVGQTTTPSFRCGWFLVSKYCHRTVLRSYRKSNCNQNTYFDTFFPSLFHEEKPRLRILEVHIKFELGLFNIETSSDIACPAYPSTWEFFWKFCYWTYFYLAKDAFFISLHEVSLYFFLCSAKRFFPSKVKWDKFHFCFSG